MVVPARLTVWILRHLQGYFVIIRICWRQLSIALLARCMDGVSALLPDLACLLRIVNDNEPADYDTALVDDHSPQPQGASNRFPCSGRPFSSMSSQICFGLLNQA